MKKIIILLIFLAFFLGGALGETVEWTDALGRQVSLEKKPERAVSFLGSFGESWLLSGGNLSGVTEDALSERGLWLPESTAIIGTNKKPNLELTTALSPDFLLLSADLETHLVLRPVLETLSVPYAFFSVNTWQEYMAMMDLCCRINGTEEAYTKEQEKIEKPIEKLIEKAQNHPLYGKQTVLLLRAYSTGVKAKGSDNLAGAILKDMGLINIADGRETLLENLTLEAILALNPDYIMITTMGNDPEAAKEAMERQLTKSPAWQALSAVQKGRVLYLDRTLFHLKPNSRWAESYQIIGDILYAP